MRRETRTLLLIALAVLLLLWIGLDLDLVQDVRGLAALFAEAAGQVWHSWFG